MANISLRGSNQNSATSVSNIFIDEYMSDANGEFVKIYLYLLRLINAPDTAFSLSSIADKFEHTEKDVRRALCYWERMHLLQLEYDDAENLTGICLLDSVSKKAASDSNFPQNTTAAAFPETQIAVSVPEAKTAPQRQTAPKTPAAVPKTAASGPSGSALDMAETIPASVPEKKSYSADDIRQFRQDESVAELFFLAERYLGRTLNATDINTFLYLYDGLHFSAELIEYLVEYCVSKKHTSIRYIEKVALGWSDNRITTVEEAKQSTSLRSQSCTTVMKSLGISGRNLVPAETAYIEKWKSEYNFTDELIGEACQRTMSTIHQPSFEYVDSILNSWYKNQIKNLGDVARLDTEHQNRKKNAAQTVSAKSAAPNKFNNFTQRSYDYDQLEQMLLTTSAN